MLNRKSHEANQEAFTAMQHACFVFFLAGSDASSAIAAICRAESLVLGIASWQISLAALRMASEATRWRWTKWSKKSNRSKRLGVGDSLDRRPIRGRLQHFRLCTKSSQRS